MRSIISATHYAGLGISHFINETQEDIIIMQTDNIDPNVNDTNKEDIMETTDIYDNNLNVIEEENVPDQIGFNDTPRIEAMTTDDFMKEWVTRNNGIGQEIVGFNRYYEDQGIAASMITQMRGKWRNTSSARYISQMEINNRNWRFGTKDFQKVLEDRAIEVENTIGSQWFARLEKLADMGLIGDTDLSIAAVIDGTSISVRSEALETAEMFEQMLMRHHVDNFMLAYKVKYDECKDAQKVAKEILKDDFVNIQKTVLWHSKEVSVEMEGMEFEDRFEFQKGKVKELINTIAAHFGVNRLNSNIASWVSRYWWMVQRGSMETFEAKKEASTRLEPKTKWMIIKWLNSLSIAKTMESHALDNHPDTLWKK
jgi:hypothetical protein